MRNSRRLFSISIVTFALFATPSLFAQNQNPLGHSPLSGGFLAAKAFKEGRLHVQPGYELQVKNPNLTCSPAPCVFPNVDASEGGRNPVDEDPIVANPTNSMQLLSGGNDYNCGNIQGYFGSSDGGSTWSHTCSPGSGGDGDPIVGYDLNNVAYAGGIQGSGVSVFSSTDNGMHFGTPVQVIGPALGGQADKPWMEIDTNPNSPLNNAIYVSTTQFDTTFFKTQIWVSHSTDGGKTWASVGVGTPGNGTMIDQFSDLAVGSDGTVYLNWLRCPDNGPAGDCGSTVANIMFSKSTDGGKTWSTPAVAATTTLAPDTAGCCFYGQLPNTNERVSNVPANGVFGSASTAKLYSAFYNWTGTQMQMEVVGSTNGGSSWGTPIIVNPSSTSGDQFFQWLNVNSKNGRVGVTWLDRRNDPANLSYQPFFAYSRNGTSYSNGHALSTVKSNPNNDGFSGTFMGDYTGNAWDGKAMYMSYMDTRTGTCQDEIGGVQF